MNPVPVLPAPLPLPAAVGISSPSKRLHPLPYSVCNDATPSKMARTTGANADGVDDPAGAGDARTLPSRGASIDAAEGLRKSLEAIERLQKGLSEGASLDAVLEAACNVPDLIREMELPARSLLWRWTSGQPLGNSERAQLSAEVERVMDQSGWFEPVSGLAPPVTLPR